MPDPHPDEPRVEVRLPGGRTIPARLLRWRQDKTGAWWAEVTIHVPAGAVGKVDGVDYTGVPREPAETTFLLVSPTADQPQPLITVHTPDCFTVKRHSTHHRVQEISARDARTMIAKFDDTEACQICHPEP